MSDADLEHATEVAAHGLSTALHELNGGMVTKWVAVFEYLTPDGEVRLGSMSSPGIMKWDVNGMLNHILQFDNADTINQVLGTGDDK